MGRKECEGSRGEATGGGEAADGGGVRGEERRLTGRGRPCGVRARDRGLKMSCLPWTRKRDALPRRWQERRSWLEKQEVRVGERREGGLALQGHTWGALRKGRLFQRVHQ